MDDVERRRTLEAIEGIMDDMRAADASDLAARVETEVASHLRGPARVEVIRSDETDEVVVTGWVYAVIVDADDVAEEVAEGRPVEHVLENRADPRERSGPREAMLSILQAAEGRIPDRFVREGEALAGRLPPIGRAFVEREGGVVQAVHADPDVTVHDGVPMPSGTTAAVDACFAAFRERVVGPNAGPTGP